MENFEVICTYTRADALKDNEQVEITKLAKEYGFVFPVFITKSVNDIVEESTQYGCNDRNGVLWDILTILMVSIKSANQDISRLTVKILITWENDKHKECEFIVTVGAMDFNNPSPALTIMTSNDI